MAATTGPDDKVAENILYDLTIHAEWPQDPETINRVLREKSQISLTGRVTAAVSRTSWTFLRSLGIPLSSASPCTLPASLVKLVNSQLLWNIAVSPDGRNVAVLQDQIVEIRSSRDDFSTVLGRCNLGRDAYVQWRRLVWSPDGDMLACSDSSGQVYVYDILGTQMIVIPSVQSDTTEEASQQKPNTPVDLSRALAGLIFKEYKGTGQWSAELLVANFQGCLRSYLIGWHKCYQKFIKLDLVKWPLAYRSDGEHQLSHQFLFSREYPRGITSMLYSSTHGLLLIGGLAEPNSHMYDTKTARQHGITAWRELSDFPHYKLVTDYEEDKQRAKQNQFIRKLKNLRHYPYSWWYADNQDGIYKLSLSPEGHLLSAIHHSGQFSIWDIPSLRIRKMWVQEDQPDFNEYNPTITENPKRRKQMKEYLASFNLMDSNWWSEEAVILSRGTGALTVSSCQTLCNLLGQSPEWFEPGPLVSAAKDGGFLTLECESKFNSLKRRMTEREDEYEDSEDEEDATVVTKTTRYMKHVLYYVTDIERFQPPRKKPKIVTRTYRLVCLKKTTPEELYARKIDHEEYGEALQLAKAYGLDCDLVYQRQWRKTTVSVASIQDYLSKISKRSWVLHECLERVPGNIDAMRELLQYGLRGTDLEALIAIGKGEDGGRFILCDRLDVYDDSIDLYSADATEKAKEKENEKRRELLQEIDFSSLTLEQKELCRARKKLLQYLDRLSTYEQILGGPHAAEERYNNTEFEDFRAKNIVELAVDYARTCDWQSLDLIFTYHGADTLPHRLTILANFPETFSPTEYRTLLPEAGSQEEDSAVLLWEEHSWRDQDFCELPECRSVIEPVPADYGAFLYEDSPDYEQFKGSPLSLGQVESWYHYRACEIEACSRLVDHALELLRLAMERNIQGLNELYDSMVTMETLVYECQIDTSLTFADLLKMSNIDKLRLMMASSSEEMYVKNVHRWLLPFLQRCEKQQPTSFDDLIEEYLISMAEEDLTLCLKVFESSKADQPTPVITDETKVISLALECIYACQSNDQLSNAFGILECLPQRGFGVVSEFSTRLHNQVDELECHLSAAETFENNDLPQTVAFIRETQDNPEEAEKLFTKLTRMAGRKSPPLSEAQWYKLQTDLMSLQDKVYHCIQPSLCYEIFVESLLCSSRPENINLAGEMIERSTDETAVPSFGSSSSSIKDSSFYKVPHTRAVELVLSSAREYFDSSANLGDANMDLARMCLGLIGDTSPPVAEELDLIEAVALLDGFGVSMLPIQVRMSNDRLELVQKSIDSKPFTYKNSQRLLRLGVLLRVSGDDDTEKQGKVLKLVAQAALKNKDLKCAYEICFRLMETGYAPIWTECMVLAKSEDFQNIQAKTEMLCFAVTHCSPDMIEPVLRAKSLLEMQTSYEKVHNHVQDCDSQSPMDSPFSARGAIAQTREILTSTTATTRTVLSSVSDKRWWKKTFKSLQPKTVSDTQSYVQLDDRNKAMEKQGCHPFYESVMDHCYLNRSEGDYVNYSLPRLKARDALFTEAVLRTVKLEETITEGRTSQPTTEVLLQLAQDIVAQDTSLGLAYLLDLPKPTDADKCFDKNPRTAMSLQLATYYYALQIFTLFNPDSEAQVKELYLHEPSDVIHKVIGHVTKTKESAWPAGVSELVPRLLHFQELLADYVQAQVLQGLGRGVDVARFTQDVEYKQETILGLAMTLEQSVYEIAVSLAKRYNLQMWDIYMTHLEFLFDSGISTPQIADRVLKELGILPALVAKPREFHQRMEKYVYPGIAGNDHVRLMYYYTLLEGCGIKEGITADIHVKLLKKIKPAAPGLDYKKLMDGKHRPLDVLMPVLNSGNVHVIAKMANKIPDKFGGKLQPSVVFCTWAIKVFWEGEQGKHKTPETTSDWVHRYEACGEYMLKLLPSDVIQFIDGITFVPQALEKLTMDCRHELIRRALKFSRQQAGAHKRKADQTNSVSWEYVASHMQQSLDHLDRLGADVISTLNESDNKKHQGYADKFDLSRSDEDKLLHLLTEMVLDGEDPAMVQSVLAVNPGIKWTAQTVLSEALTIITQSFRNPDDVDPLLLDKDVLDVLQTVVGVVSLHEKQGNGMVKSEDVMVLLRPFCADPTVAVKPRLDVLQILEKSFELSAEDLVLLILYRTQAVVSMGWKDKQLDEDSIKTDSSRQWLFESLLAVSDTMEQFVALSNLLQVWPLLSSMDARENHETHPWCQVVEAMVKKCPTACGVHCVKLMKELQMSRPLSAECSSHIFDILHDAGLSMVAVKTLLVTQHSQLYEKAVAELKSHIEPVEDDELLLLILQRHLTSSLVNSPYYETLVQYLLTSQTPGQEPAYYLDVENIANQLQEAGFDAEAGSLMLQFRGTHPGLRTFDVALGVLTRWFTR